MATVKSGVTVVILFMGMGKNQITVNKDLNKMVRRRLIKENKLMERSDGNEENSKRN